VWVYGSSASSVLAHVRTLAETYNRALQSGLSREEVPRHPQSVSWSRRLLGSYAQGTRLSVNEAANRIAHYRPFYRQHVYFSAALNEDRRRLPELFPTASTQNHGILLTGVSSHYEFCCIASNDLPDLHLLDTGQFFARWRYEKVDDSGMFEVHEGEVVDGYRRIDNITDEALAAFTAAYPGESITKDDIFDYVYGLLHSSEYRETYAADLKKMLPRIPFAADFRAFAAAGKQLAELHLGYETVQPYPLEGLDVQGPGGEADYGFFAVRDKKMGFGKSTAEQKAEGARNDRSVIHYNDRITLRGVPLEAYRYMLGSRSAIEWIIDRYWVKTDKTSGIVNDPNDWSREVGNPRYILDLLARVVTVSLETMKVVDALPRLDICHPA
jgi:predicted helicase